MPAGGWMDKVWVVRDADQYFYRQGVRRATKGLPFADEKNPAKAFTFSLFLWGAGQNYSGLRMRSVVYQTLMLLFLSISFFLYYFASDLLELAQRYGISYAEVFLCSEFVLLTILTFWHYNAVDAYHAATRARRVPFHGVENRFLPMFSSLFIPGWGQFMNGQPVKGLLLSVFSVLNYFSLITISAVLIFWSSFQPSPARSLIESVFSLAVLYAPFVPVISLLSSYDAFRISIDDSKKETPLDRIVFALNRIRTEGWMRHAALLARSLFLLALVIGMLIIAFNEGFFPAAYFSGYLSSAEDWMRSQGMTLVPDLINSLRSVQYGSIIK